MHVNSQSHSLSIGGGELLIDVLRDSLRLTGTKRGCDDSSCGACTVLVDGVPVLSCTVLAASVDGREVTTIEGASAEPVAQAIQRAFGRIGGAQCGYCTPGMIMAAKALLDITTSPSDDELQQALSGNICRCTGYVQIIRSIREALAEAYNGQNPAQPRV
jgi:aerobic-type carbon monoxide dehydrogenase small subunit (CoxS/CutS family)